jgi:hypothetical protein
LNQYGELPIMLYCLFCHGTPALTRSSVVYSGKNKCVAVDWDPPHDGKSGRCSLRNAKPNWLTQVSPSRTGAEIAAFGKCGDSQCRSFQIISRAKPPLTAIPNSFGGVGHLLQRPILRGCRDERPLRPMALPSGRDVPFHHVTKLEALFV